MEGNVGGGGGGGGQSGAAAAAAANNATATNSIPDRPAATVAAMTTTTVTARPETNPGTTTTITTPFNIMSGGGDDNDEARHPHQQHQHHDRRRQYHQQQQQQRQGQGQRSGLMMTMMMNQSLDIKDPRRWDSRRRLLDDDDDDDDDLLLPSHPPSPNLSHPMITNRRRIRRTTSSSNKRSSDASLVVTSDGIHNLHASTTSTRNRRPSMVSHDGGFTLSQRHFPAFMSTIASEQGGEEAGDDQDFPYRNSTNKRDSSTYDEASYSVSSIVDRSSFEDQSDAIQSFFSSIRVPASFIVSTSFSQMFGIYTSDSNGDVDENGDIDYKNSTMVQQYLQGFCVGFQFITFMLSLSVVMFSTAALIRGLTKNFDPRAENGYELLFREFHYEFIVTRWSFQISLFGFLVAVCSKILYEFELFNVTSPNYSRQHLEIGIAIVLLMSSLSVHLFSYINSTLIGWKNMTDMTLDLFRILWWRGTGTTFGLEAIALLMFFAGLIFVVLALIPGGQI